MSASSRTHHWLSQNQRVGINPSYDNTLRPVSRIFLMRRNDERRNEENEAMDIFENRQMNRSEDSLS